MNAINQEPVRNAFLFAWNPVKFLWPEIGEQSELLQSGGKVTEDWTCAGHKKIKPGDRAFVSHVGAEPRGIFASGHIASEPFMGRNRKGNMTYRVWIDLDVLLVPAREPVLTLELLNIGPLSKQMWTPQSSGISIKPELVNELEALWQDFLSYRGKDPATINL